MAGECERKESRLNWQSGSDKECISFLGNILLKFNNKTKVINSITRKRKSHGVSHHLFHN